MSAVLPGSGNTPPSTFHFSISNSFADVLLRRLIELGLAAFGAEVDGLALVITAGGGFLRINGHLADRVNDLHDPSSAGGEAVGGDARPAARAHSSPRGLARRATNRPRRLAR